jgi:hypothetical protein
MIVRMVLTQQCKIMLFIPEDEGSLFLQILGIQAYRQVHVAVVPNISFFIAVIISDLRT